jgi:hypothetical protein
MTDVTTVDLAEFTCPECGRTSQNPHDVRARYCAWCHWWTGDPVMAVIRRDAPIDEVRVTWLGEQAPADRVVRGVARVASPTAAGRVAVTVGALRTS